MIMWDKKKAMESIMAKRHPDTGASLNSGSPSAHVEGPDSMGNMDARHYAAMDMIEAMHAKDPVKLTHAMANFHALHMATPERDEHSDGGASTA